MKGAWSSLVGRFDHQHFKILRALAAEPSSQHIPACSKTQEVYLCNSRIFAIPVADSEMQNVPTQGQARKIGFLNNLHDPSKVEVVPNMVQVPFELKWYIIEGASRFGCISTLKGALHALNNDSRT